MVRVKRDLERFDSTDLLKLALEVRMLKTLGDLADEDIVGHEPLSVVTTEQLPVELKGSALLAIDLEIFHGLNCLGEGLWIFDANNG